ncbi:MAG: hypothetical protein PVI99_05435 [Anaerolineales bacterium]|jgi:hypothetical protein
MDTLAMPALWVFSKLNLARSNKSLKKNAGKSSTINIEEPIRRQGRRPKIGVILTADLGGTASKQSNLSTEQAAKGMDGKSRRFQPLNIST